MVDWKVRSFIKKIVKMTIQNTDYFINTTCTRSTLLVNTVYNINLFGTRNISPACCRQLNSTTPQLPLIYAAVTAFWIKAEDTARKVHFYYNTWIFITEGEYFFYKICYDMLSFLSICHWLYKLKHLVYNSNTY